MKNIYLLILTAAAAIIFTACGGTAENKPANTATNTSQTDGGRTDG